MFAIQASNNHFMTTVLNETNIEVSSSEIAQYDQLANSMHLITNQVSLNGNAIDERNLNMNTQEKQAKRFKSSHSSNISYKSGHESLNHQKISNEVLGIIQSFDEHQAYAQAIKIILNKVSNENLFKTLNQTFTLSRPSLDTKKMLNTFIYIAEEILNPKHQTDYFVGKQKFSQLGLNTFSFAISKNFSHIFVASSNKRKGGSFKVPTDVVDLTNPEGSYLRLKLRKTKKHDDKYITVIQKEVELIELFSKLNPYMAENVLFKSCKKIKINSVTQIISEVRQFAIYQKRYPGTGKDLAKASFENQIHCLQTLAKGMALLHDQGYVYLDMKPRNFCLSKPVEEDFIEAKIIDVGGVIKGVRNGLNRTGLYVSSSEITCTYHYAPLQDFKKTVGYYSAINGEKFDSFTLGSTILYIIASSNLIDLDETILNIINTRNIRSNDAPYLGNLTQDEILEILMEVEASLLETTTTNFQHNAVLDLCQMIYELLKVEPNERISCLEASYQLEDIKTILAQKTH